jgi:hypothetical protein
VSQVEISKLFRYIPYKNINKILLCLITILFVTAISVPSLAVAVDSGKQITYRVPSACSKYIDEIEKYAWDSSLIIKIMYLESGCRHTAVGDGHLTFNAGAYGMSCGLMQVRILPKRGVTCEQMKDPRANIAMAYEVYKSQGYKAWSVYKQIKKL